MVENGTTAIIVSHDIKVVKDVCNKAIWLEHGKIKKMETFYLFDSMRPSN